VRDRRFAEKRYFVTSWSAGGAPDLGAGFPRTERLQGGASSGGWSRGLPRGVLVCNGQVSRHAEPIMEAWTQEQARAYGRRYGWCAGARAGAVGSKFSISQASELVCAVAHTIRVPSVSTLLLAPGHAGNVMASSESGRDAYSR